MKYFYIILFFGIQIFGISCKSTKQIYKVIAPKDTVIVESNTASGADSMLLVNNSLEALSKNVIDFKTFSAKIKLDIEDAKGKQPDITATVRMIKDSVIWISLNATFLNIEVYRVYITPDSVILMNKQEKEVQYRSMDYLQEVTQIPFDFKTLQDMLIGNPVFFNKTNASFKKTEELILISCIGNDFKNLLTFSANTNLLMHSKLDDVDVFRNRTASITYDDYAVIDDKFFSSKRQITISEKSKLDIKMNIKQFEFNKELSVSFSVPKNYKKK